MTEAKEKPLDIRLGHSLTPEVIRTGVTDSVLANIEGQHENPELHSQVTGSIRNLLDRIADKMDRHEIDPTVMDSLRFSKNQASSDETRRLHMHARVGLFPVAANPIHWGQIETALSAIVQHDLSGVVFILQGPGDTDKPEIELTLDERQQMADAAIASFRGLLRTSTISYETHGRGEKTAFDFMEINQDLIGPAAAANGSGSMTWVYMAGSDHQHVWKESLLKKRQWDPEYFAKPIDDYDFDQELDTIGKFYQTTKTKSDYLRKIGQNIEVLFNNRPGNQATDYQVESDQLKKAADTFKFGQFNGQTFAASSTEIRKKIMGEPSAEAAVTLPVSVMRLIESPQFERYRAVIAAQTYTEKIGHREPRLQAADFQRLVENYLVLHRSQTSSR